MGCYDEIFEAIKKYAEAYDLLEGLQGKRDDLLPVGDQKTGVIGEFYGRLFAKRQYSDSEHRYGSPSQPAWDITIRRSGQGGHKIQIKTVSAYSKTNRVSIIHPGWHELYLLRLDKDFQPEGFWTLLASRVDWSSDKLKGSAMPRPHAPNSGSQSFSNATDKLDVLLSILAEVNRPTDPTSEGA